MSLEPFPERVDPRKLFTRNGEVNGVVALSRLKRLGHYLSNENGQVEASLRFGRDESKQRLVSGSLKGNVQMLCQRCLSETTVELATELYVVVLGNTDKGNERARELLANDIDAVQVDEDDLDVLSLIEDELILGLPIVVMHAEKDCNNELNRLNVEAVEAASTEVKPSAFAGLATLKKDLQ